MILYVNGDSHTAAAEAVNPHAFAEDDSTFFYLGRAPHPTNLAVSWGRHLSLALRTGFYCAAESASSNTRIMRTTRAWLQTLTGYNEVLVIIQWSTWEREEWLIEDTYYQINASGIDHVPQSHQQQYKEFVAGVDWTKKTQQAHDEIWAFHQELEAQGIRHIFVNGNTDFSKIANRQSWGTNYIGPYDPSLTYNAIVRAKGVETAAPNSYHFGKDGHSVFHRFMLQYIIENKYI
jgi:hypothetical protein